MPEGSCTGRRWSCWCEGGASRTSESCTCIWSVVTGRSEGHLWGVCLQMIQRAVGTRWYMKFDFVGVHARSLVCAHIVTIVAATLQSAHLGETESVDKLARGDLLLHVLYQRHQLHTSPASLDCTSTRPGLLLSGQRFLILAGIRQNDMQKT